MRDYLSRQRQSAKADAAESNSHPVGPWERRFISVQTFRERKARRVKKKREREKEAERQGKEGKQAAGGTALQTAAAQEKKAGRRWHRPTNSGGPGKKTSQRRDK